MRIVKKLDVLLADQRAITAIEYAILAGVLGLTLAGLLHNLGGTLATTFRTIGGKV